MNFEIEQTIEEVLRNGVKCTLNYTPDFVEYVNAVDGEYSDLEPFDEAILASLENLIYEYDISKEITATAFISDDDSYVYVKEMDVPYMLAVLPVGNNAKYRACLVASVL